VKGCCGSDELPSAVVADPAAAAELTRECAYLPLALRIAAANLTDYPQRGGASYVAELRNGNRLAKLAVEGDPENAVRAAFELSYGSLDQSAARLFRLLSLAPRARSFPGGQRLPCRCADSGGPATAEPSHKRAPGGPADSRKPRRGTQYNQVRAARPASRVRR
jgi:hypothetical protein